MLTARQHTLRADLKALCFKPSSRCKQLQDDQEGRPGRGELSHANNGNCGLSPTCIGPHFNPNICGCFPPTHIPAVFHAPSPASLLPPCYSLPPAHPLSRLRNHPMARVALLILRLDLLEAQGGVHAWPDAGSKVAGGGPSERVRNMCLARKIERRWKGLYM